MPRVVTAGVPMRTPLVTNGERVSNGTAFLIHRDARFIEGLLRDLAGQFRFAQIDEHQMIVGAVGSQAKPVSSSSRLRERLGVFDDLLLINFKFRAQGFFERHRFGGDHVHQRPALHARKNFAVDRLGMLGFAQHHAAARPAQGFMRGRGDKIGVRHRTRMQSRRDQPGDMRHVHHQKAPISSAILRKRG